MGQSHPPRAARAALLAAVAGLAALAGAARPAGAVSLTLDLDDLEGIHATPGEERRHSFVFSDDEIFRLHFMTLEIEGAGVCDAIQCDPPPSFRFLIGMGVSINLGPYPDVFSDTVPLALFRPITFRVGEPFELGLSLGRYPESNSFLVPEPSAVTDVTRVAVTFTGDFFPAPVPEPGAAGLTALAAGALAAATACARRRAPCPAVSARARGRGGCGRRGPDG